MGAKPEQHRVHTLQSVCNNNLVKAFRRGVKKRVTTRKLGEEREKVYSKYLLRNTAICYDQKLKVLRICF